VLCSDEEGQWTDQVNLLGCQFARSCYRPHLPSPFIVSTHTHTPPFNGPFSGTTRVSRYQKGKPIWILLKQETVNGSGICWAVGRLSRPSSSQCSRVCSSFTRLYIAVAVVIKATAHGLIQAWDFLHCKQAVASTRVQGWVDEPCELTVRLPDWSELVASYSRMKTASGWANGGQPILVCYIRKYVIILAGIVPLTFPQPKYLEDVSPASPAGLTPVQTGYDTIQYEMLF